MKTSIEVALRSENPTYCNVLRNLRIQDAYVPLVRCDQNQENSSCVNMITSYSSCSSLHTSSYKTNTPSLCLLECCTSSNELCSSNMSERETTPFYSSTSKKDSPLIRSISNSSDEDMNVNSPDSGFASIPASTRSLADFTDDELSKSPSSSIPSPPSPPSPQPLNLLPPLPKPVPKVEVEVPTIVCKWKNCTSTFTSNESLQDHVSVIHVEPTKERFSCFWIGCRYYDKPARTIKWLRSHVASHTGKKRFQCVLEGCGATFSTPQGVARHVPSHFNESNIPKARVTGNLEKKCLVKKRRIRDQTKALANIHDCMDQHCLELMQKFLVQKAENARRPNATEATRKRTHEDGTLWYLTDNQQWSKDNCANKNLYESLFFSRPAKRCRKYKA